MDVRTILSHIDHTLLKPTASLADIAQLCKEAYQHKTASVCIPPSYVYRMKQLYGDQLVVGTVVGFPLGYNTTAIKVEETRKAVSDGADEIDMVINIADVKNGDYDAVEMEIAAVRFACPNKLLKVIVEACYLTDDEKRRLCEIVTGAHADYIKTSTGTAFGGATRHDIVLFREHIGPHVKIKAAGGIRTLDDIEMYMNEGCDRVGTSAAISVLQELGVI